MPQHRLNWDLASTDRRIINEIVDRYQALTKGEEKELNVIMDIVACHLNGCPLDLQRLADADDFNFCHDVCGIRDHIDRKTGQLRDFFLPRTALKTI